MFNFTKDSLKLTDKEIKDALEFDPGKFMQKGEHSVKIVSAKFNVKDGSYFSKKDPTWFSVEVNMENAAKQQIRHWLLVPTSSLLYNEGPSKRPEFMFLQFKKFCDCFGIPVSADPKVLNKSCKKYFEDPSKLTGLSGTIVVGYKGYYIDYTNKGALTIKDQNDKIVVSEAFTDKNSALLKAIDLKLTLEKGVSITEFIDKSVKKTVVLDDEIKAESSSIEEEW